MRTRLLPLSLAAFLAGSAAKLSGQEIMPASITQAQPASPLLLADAADFARLREVAARPGLHRDLARYIQACADRELEEPVITRVVVGRRMLHTSRAVLRRVVNGGITYQLTGDERYARRVIADLRSAAAFSDWHPAHFLDTAEMTCAFALGLDWLRGAMSAEELELIEDAVIRLGLEPGLASKQEWVRSENNWNAVCHGSLAMGAIAVRQRRPDLTDALVERAFKYLPLHGKNFAPAGAFIEGPMYWDYGTNFHVLAVEALRRFKGDAQGLDTLPGFRESAAYMVHVTGPSGQFYNYFDCRLRRVSLPALAWFGARSDQPWLTAVEGRAYAELIRKPLPPSPSEEHRLFALALLWLHPVQLQRAAALPPPVLHWSETGPNPVALWRDAWTPEATWVGAKGGRATLSHGHIDAGSFVFEAGGVRWAVDPGMEEYDRIERLGVKLWGEDRWTLFRLGAEGHSIPRIDGAVPDPAGACPRIDWKTTPSPSVTFDLTKLYPKHVSRLHRTIASGGDGRRTHWRDEVCVLAPDATYRFTWMTTAHVQVESTGAVLSQNGRRLRLICGGAGPVKVSVVDATSLYRPADSPVAELKRIEFAVRSTGGDFSFELSAALER